MEILEKKKAYTDNLLQTLRNLEVQVSSIGREESASFSFFREAFQKSQEITRLLHELEMLQIEDMKRQMEKLVLFLSQSENQKPVAEETKTVEFEETDIDKAATIIEPEVNKEEQIFSEETQKIVEEEKVVRRNVYAEGITLPTYSNPRNVESKQEEVVDETPVVNQVETDNGKPVIRSVNDIIQAPPAKLDVRRGLSLNDRFYYQRELFDNNREAMNSMMLRLNAFDNYEATEQYLRENTSWDFEDENVKSFLELLKKGFE